MSRTHSMAAIVAVALLAAGAAWAAETDLPVTLTVAEPAGLDRTDEPVTTGIPFAAGKLAAGETLALADAAGAAVPLQTRVLAHWPDGSVKWVLLDFQARVLANGQATFTLSKGKPAAPARPLAVSKAGDSLVLDTGPMQATVSGKVFDLLASVKVGGRERISGAGKGGLVLTDVGGKTYDSIKALDGALEVKVMEAGPLRTVVRVVGQMQATDKDKLGFTCWYHFYAGKKFVRVFFTVRNLNGQAFTGTDQNSVQDMAYRRMVGTKPGNPSLEAADLVLAAVRGEGKPAFAIGGDKPITGQLDDGAVKLYQDSSACWTWQIGDGNIVDPRLAANKRYMASTGKPDLPYFEYEPGQYSSLTDKQNYVGCTFRGYRFYDAAGKQAGQGDRAPGWAQLGSTTVGIRWLWQMYPKSISLASDGTIRLGLFPAEWSNPHVFEGHVHKTHELLLAFDEADGAAAGSFGRFDHRLMAMAPNTYYCASGAFNGYLMPEDRDDNARFEDWALTAVKCGVNRDINPSYDSSLEVEREKYDHYSVWHFGDTSKRGWRGFGQYLELDIPYCLMVHYVRTLNRAFFDEAEIHVRQQMDVPAHGGGYGHQKGESSHYYTSGDLFYYYMTGLQQIRQSVKVSHDAFARVAPWHARSFGITMWSNLDMYLEFGEDETTLDQPWNYPAGPWKKSDYMTNIQNDLKWFLGNPNRPNQDPATGWRGYGQLNFQEFMLGMMMDSLGRYCMNFPDQQEWRDRLVALANAVLEDNPEQKYKTEFLTINNSNGFAYAYLFTGDEKFLKMGDTLFERGLRPGDKEWPRYRTGTGSGKFWSEFGHRNSQTYAWARWMTRQHGVPTRPAAITDLAATRDGDKLVLTWTTPSGAGETVDHYFVKVADKPIQDNLKTKDAGKTAANWWTTPLAAAAPAVTPKPGAKQTLAVPVPAGAKGGLYVAVRSVEDRGPMTLVSELSNVAEVK